MNNAIADMMQYASDYQMDRDAIDFTPLARCEVNLVSPADGNCIDSDDQTIHAIAS